jgi:hypothetical protein
MLAIHPRRWSSDLMNHQGVSVVALVILGGWSTVRVKVEFPSFETECSRHAHIVWTTRLIVRHEIPSTSGRTPSQTAVSSRSDGSSVMESKSQNRRLGVASRGATNCGTPSDEPEVAAPRPWPCIAQAATAAERIRPSTRTRSFTSSKVNRSSGPCGAMSVNGDS